MSFAKTAYCGLVCAVIFQASRVWAAHSRRRPVFRRESPPRYDRSITTFSEEGLLQQVMYSMEASRRGQTVAAFATEECVSVAVASSSDMKVHRIDEHVLLITSGLVGDGRALAAYLRISCQNFRLQNGEAPYIKDVAELSSGLQHQLTRTGGARPLASTACLVGVDPSGLKLYQTEPGGSMEQCRYAAAGKLRDQAMTALKELEDEWAKLLVDDDGDTPENLSVGGLAKGVVKSVLQGEWDEDDKDSVKSVDVWVIQKDATRRGNIRMTCALDVSRHNMDHLMDVFHPATKDE
eukprot:CAMPEP_0195296144 /NCGR_PEP_ID=MMETSP0707-20130614/18858_1 /TAXON_ID=33640 /ORGANISM="Asterionellopsis glacialis, Strain CCMP134" /LENGTH=293 /DNA_ID=CAMNT_0040357563 /DNA_START=36 /DNA_END=917 /DNA_ORIENTATION=-